MKIVVVAVLVKQNTGKRINKIKQKTEPTLVHIINVRKVAEWDAKDGGVGRRVARCRAMRTRTLSSSSWISRNAVILL